MPRADTMRGTVFQAIREEKIRYRWHGGRLVFRWMMSTTDDPYGYRLLTPAQRRVVVDGLAGADLERSCGLVTLSAAYQLAHPVAAAP